MKTFLDEKVLENILPTYEMLTETSLLERCAKGLTQNSNESIHSRVWRKCPKTSFASKRRVEIAVADTICEFNSGIANATMSKHKLLGLQTLKNSVSTALNRDNRRLSQLQSRQANEYDRVRKIVQQAISQREKEISRAEGATYGAGKF